MPKEVLSCEILVPLAWAPSDDDCERLARLGDDWRNQSLLNRNEYSAVAVKRWHIVSCTPAVAIFETGGVILHVDSSTIILYYMHLQI